MRLIAIIGGSFLLLMGCLAQPQADSPAETQPSKPQSTDSVGMAALSYGAIKKHLKVGASSQADVVKLLGSPNNMTMTSNGNELWIYDRISTESSTSGERSSSGAILGIGGASGGVGGGAAIGGSSSSSQSRLVSSTKTLTVILEFKNEILVDLLAREGRY